MAEQRNCKDLLELERSSTAVSSSSALESKLIVCKNDSLHAVSEVPSEKPTMFPVPKSEIFGKLKNFLGVMSESNKKLLQDAKENPENYDIEVLSGKKSEVIEMDLMLGIADLHTPEAVAAAERAIAGYQPKIPITQSCSGSEDEDDDNSDNEESDGDEEEGKSNKHDNAHKDDDDDDVCIKDDKVNKKDDKSGSESMQFGSRGSQRVSSLRVSRKKKRRKHPTIVELS